VNNQQSAGVPLANTPLSVVSLTAGTTTTTSQPAAPPTQHHINPVLLGFSIVLFVLAIAMFYATSRSVKNTTK
jgi:hypothetical protein